MDFFNLTLDFYEKNASAFINDTINVDMSLAQDIFLSFLEKNDYILDLGCGAGRDAKYFVEKGFKVDAIDGCKSFCVAASLYTGVNVKNLLFTDLNEKSKYDGVWACSSILHSSKSELKIVMNKIHKSLKDNGILYTSFKYGTDEGMRNGRYFIDFTKESFKLFLDPLKLFDIKKIWITNDVRQGRENEKWLNVILVRI